MNKDRRKAPMVTDPREHLTKLSGRMDVDGVTFEAWRTGVLQTDWFSEDGRIHVRKSDRRTGGTTASCCVDGVFIMSKANGRPKQFRGLRSAALAGIKEFRDTAGAPCTYCRRRAGRKVNGQCKGCGRRERVKP